MNNNPLGGAKIYFALHPTLPNDAMYIWWGETHFNDDYWFGFWYYKKVTVDLPPNVNVTTYGYFMEGSNNYGGGMTTSLLCPGNGADQAWSNSLFPSLSCLTTDCNTTAWHTNSSNIDSSQCAD